MKRKFLILFMSLLFCCTYATAQEKSSLQQRADEEAEKGNVAPARFNYIRAFEDYVNRGLMKQGVECGVKATQLYYKENYYKEAFDLLRRIDQQVIASKKSPSETAQLYYYTSKERLQMYIKLRKLDSAKDQLKALENHANASSDETIKNDLLYTKAIYYYTFGMNAQGNAVFKEMAQKLTASKEYDKVEEAYKTLITNGRHSNSANIVAQSYSSYMAWKDSTTILKHADEMKELKQQIAANQKAIDDKDSSLTTRMTIIIGLCVLAAALAIALVVGAIVLMRFIVQTRKQKKVIRLANDNNALKAKFINNIAAQLEPTLKKLDTKQPEVKALIDFSNHIQTLSELESTIDDEVELEEIQIPAFCEQLAEQIKCRVKNDVTVKVDAPKMSVSINKEYVSHILTHLLNNAVLYTPEGGHIAIDFKKRGAHTHQFLISNTGSFISEEDRNEVFKSFREVKDLTQGDGLGLPICKQMALKMKGDLEIDPLFTKGTRFILELHS